ncbi:MAG: glycosyltransferase, partial [Candidatus Korarchaeota archaeon]|nr:glycosyltransferase [Candidatus Korarchaeota archaeon]
MKSNKLRTVAVIPAYNEESSIAKVILRTRRYVDRVIVCDDGSTDMTF